MTRLLTYPITKSNEGCSILEYLKSRGYSHHVIMLLKNTPRGILRNGEAAYTSAGLKTGDVLAVRLEENESSHKIRAVAMDLNIPYEDEDLLIINKAANMPVHPSQGNHENTLANGLTAYYRNQGISFTYRCINRLDRDTTGLMIVAKHILSSSILSGMIERRDIKREYLAIAQGNVPPIGVIDAPIGRKPGSALERQIDYTCGDRAVTRYHTVSSQNGYSLVSLKLETGRTHQIRVHMKHIGHPLPGDFLYNPEYSVIKRQALHSCRLAFTHPITGKALEFHAPLPQDMEFIIQPEYQ